MEIINNKQMQQIITSCHSYLQGYSRITAYFCDVTSREDKLIAVDVRRFALNILKHEI
jgi:hypothetical protein